MLPENQEELLHRARYLAGLTVGELAARLMTPLPERPGSAKGFTGQLIEIALGAGAGSHPLQDFPHLDIELKTIPVGWNGKPRETTHVCILHHAAGASFENSNVYNKLRRVLWFPVEGEPGVPLRERHLGQAFLWEPDPGELRTLREDFDEIIALLNDRDEADEESDFLISASIGTALHLRPSGSFQGKRVFSWYLRKDFTARILENAALRDMPC
ncbi:MAG: MutH/Sau3AI family endonuclease [Succinimonas sp.]|nr:MutH/Sau3AI family endonuclease [Succinimonas sp.]